jgi:hypothetical protein
MSAVSHHFLSGSDFVDMFKGEDKPMAGMLLMPSGGVQVFMSEPPPLSDDDSLGAWGEAADVTEYLLYALENPVWINQWQRMQHSLWQEAMEESRIREKESLRAHLRIIPGGKVDAD